MELYSTGREPCQLLDDIRDAWVVEQALARLPRRCVHGDVEGRQAVAKDTLEVAVLQVRERGEIAVREREPIVIVANVERLSQATRQPLDEAELAPVRTATDGRRLQLEPDRIGVVALDLVDDVLAARQLRLDGQLGFRSEKLPVEKVRDLLAVDAHDLGAGNDPELLGDAT